MTSPTATTTPQHYPISGWIEAGLYVFAIAFLSLTYVIGHRIGAHPTAFILYAMLVSAMALLLVTGPGPDALRIILAPQSWLVGAGIILMEVFFYLLLEHLSPAEGSLLVRLTIPAAIVTGWALFARRPRASAWAGCAIICAGLAPAYLNIAPAHRWEVAVAMLGAAFASTLRSFSIEFHPWNRAARTILEKLRVTGLVVGVTSLTSIALAGGGALLVGLGMLPPIKMIPTAAEMLHAPTILLGVLVGGAILTAMAFLNFSCVVKITTENFAATSAFTPVAALIVQIAAAAVGLIPAYTLDTTLFPAMAVVIGGVLLILYCARRR